MMSIEFLIEIQILDVLPPRNTLSATTEIPKTAGNAIKSLKCEGQTILILQEKSKFFESSAERYAA